MITEEQKPKNKKIITYFSPELKLISLAKEEKFNPEIIDEILKLTHQEGKLPKKILRKAIKSSGNQETTRFILSQSQFDQKLLQEIFLDSALMGKLDALLEMEKELQNAKSIPINDLRIINSVAKQDLEGLESAIEEFNQNIANKDKNPRWLTILSLAAESGNQEIFKKILEKMPAIQKQKAGIWESVCPKSLESGSKEMVNLVFEKAAFCCSQPIKINWTNALISATYSQNEKIFDYIMQQCEIADGINDVNWLEVFLLGAVKNFNEKMIDQIFELEEFQASLENSPPNFLERIGNLLSNHIQEQNNSEMIGILRRIANNNIFKTLSERLDGDIEIKLDEKAVLEINLSPLKAISKSFNQIIDGLLYKKSSSNNQPSTKPNPILAASLQGKEAKVSLTDLPAEIIEEFLKKYALKDPAPQR